MTEQEGWEIKPIWDEKGRKSVFPDKHVFCQIQLPNIFVKYSSPISFRFTTGRCLKGSAQRVPEPDPLPGISFDTRPDSVLEIIG